MALKTIQNLSLQETGYFPDLLLDYLNNKEDLQPFFSAKPNLLGFKTLIENRKFTLIKRKVLVEELKKQYDEIGKTANTDQFLEENTFCVTTGHQLNIFTGPLYIIYKIITTINLAKELKEAYPTYNFVPVYWLATEDHDFEEIASFKHKHQKFTWQTEQTGAVGRFDPSSLAKQLNSWGIDAPLFKEAYSGFTTLSKSVRYYMHELFGHEGLISIDSDTSAFKSLFKEVMHNDLFLHSPQKEAEKATNSIEELGYKTQIHAREINFFYLGEGLRERIEKTAEGFKVLNTDLQFTAPEMNDIIENSPEKLSPNVVLRPVYQEVILPNLAYIGGPSEVPYWLQLKGVFDYFKVDFPALVPRNFALVIQDNELAKLERLNIKPENLFSPLHKQKTKFIKENSQKEIAIEEELLKIKEQFSLLKTKTAAIEPTLKNTTEAFETKTLNLLKSLELKMLRAEKRNFSEDLVRLEKTYNALFPGGGLQERKNNVLEFNPEVFIKNLLAILKPLDFKFNVLKQD